MMLDFQQEQLFEPFICQFIPLLAKNQCTSWTAEQSLRRSTAWDARVEVQEQ